MSINLLSFAANDWNLNQMLLLGTILEQVRLQGDRNNPQHLVPQPVRVEQVYVQTRERYKTLHRNQPQRSNKNRKHHN